MVRRMMVSLEYGISKERSEIRIWPSGRRGGRNLEAGCEVEERRIGNGRAGEERLWN
jgi:hypothetical protein